ncbi:hypothetical protein BCV70DRAFT_105952 [Testicularia cyperi]|uniref:Uncharacterized protein n=1 Tax=Testicularia cyperi TaxID=1882483 RepID=A0A317XQK5_9BASI|nr:hypothetical protein BCV70DRAFT_105952 [Testicularia cyperi]
MQGAVTRYLFVSWTAASLCWKRTQAISKASTGVGREKGKLCAQDGSVTPLHGVLGCRGAQSFVRLLASEESQLKWWWAV